MEENKQNRKIKDVLIAIAVCAVGLGCLLAILIGTYKYFYENNYNEIATSNKSENDVADDSEVIELIDLESIKEEGKTEEQPKEELQQEEQLTEEEKKQQEEELKKKQEELRKKQEEEAKKQAQAYPYYIKVNYTANTVTIYKKDENGKFTVPYKAMVCSTGKSTPTSGVYKTPQKTRWGSLIGSYGQYCTRITGQILFHSVPYLKNGDKTSLEYWEYDRLGETRSLGCIRLTVIDAKWIYDNCPLGTSVEFYSSSNPGPLGKPTAKKISGYDEPFKNWDPTDPDPNNPWHNQKAIEEKKAKEEATEKKAAEEKAAKEKAEKEEAERKKAEEAEKQKNNIIVPNVVGLTEAEAQKVLKEKGFTVTVKAEINDKNNGKIIKQSLIAGSQQKKGTAITITVSQKKENTNDKNNTKTNDTESNNDKNNTNKSNTDEKTNKNGKN